MQKVVWYEGMTLDPHHFQQWDRYQRRLLHARLQAVRPSGWGLTQLDIDSDRLSNGEFVLSRCSGVLPDGVVFDMPNRETLPDPRPLQAHFPPTAERLGVFLAVPLEREGGANVRLQDAVERRETRFVAETRMVRDETTGIDERPVEVAQLNLKVLFDGEPMQAQATMQIAEVQRTGSGTYRLNPQFVPPCFTVAASEALQRLTRRVLELLVTRSTSLADRAQGATNQRALSPADVTAIGLLGTVNAYIPQLNHHLEAELSTPDDLYLTLVGLAGQLSAYLSSETHPKDYPVFNHTHPTPCFSTMEAVLREMLGEVSLPTNYVQIPLELGRDNLRIASVEPVLLRNAQFYLAAQSSSLNERRLISELPLMLRVASPQTIDNVLQSYTRALVIGHAARLPAGMPVDRQTAYFELQQSGPYWNSIITDAAIAVFVPPEYADLGLDLVALRS